jgi:hypothetical protein
VLEAVIHVSGSLTTALHVAVTNNELIARQALLIAMRLSLRARVDRLGATS